MDKVTNCIHMLVTICSQIRMRPGEGIVATRMVQGVFLRERTISTVKSLSKKSLKAFVSCNPALYPFTITDNSALPHRLSLVTQLFWITRITWLKICAEFQKLRDQNHI